MFVIGTRVGVSSVVVEQVQPAPVVEYVTPARTVACAAPVTTITELQLPQEQRRQRSSQQRQCRSCD